MSKIFIRGAMFQLRKQDQNGVQTISNLFLFAFISLLIFPVEAQEKNSGFYAGVGTSKLFTCQFKAVEGYTNAAPSTQKDFSVILGYKINNYFRADFIGHITKFQYEAHENMYSATQKFENSVVFLNGYLDFKNFTVFTPYLGMGIGFSHHKVGDLLGIDHMPLQDNYDAKGINTNSFTWRLSAGILMKLYNNIDLNFSYLFEDLGKITSDATKVRYADLILNRVSQKIRAHHLGISIIYKF